MGISWKARAAEEEYKATDQRHRADFLQAALEDLTEQFQILSKTLYATEAKLESAEAVIENLSRRVAEQQAEIDRAHSESESYRRQLTEARKQAAKFTDLYQAELERAEAAEAKLFTIREETLEEAAKVVDCDCDSYCDRKEAAEELRSLSTKGERDG